MKKVVLVCIFAYAFASCNKSESISKITSSTEKISEDEQKKVFDLRNFLSETWERPIENISYDKNDSTFRLENSEIVEKRSNVDYFYKLLKK